jgi:hypothetical protein
VPERPVVLEQVMLAEVAAVTTAAGEPAPAALAFAAPSPEVTMPALSAPPVPAAYQQLVALLGTPESLRTAVLLHEILGPPRYQRLSSR